jgi:hypothetical protein
MTRDYREKDIDGLIFDGIHIKPSRVTVRMTSDKYGQSLSLTASNIQINIPLESVRDIIRVAEKEGES